MICHPAGLDGVTFHLIEYADDVSMQSRLGSRRDGWFTVLCAEYEVNEDFGKGLGHGVISYRGLLTRKGNW